MTTSDMQYSAKEIERLNKIISALLEQIDVLKKDNLSLVSYILENEPGYSPSEKENRHSELLYSSTEKSKGIPQSGYSISETNKGMPELSHSYTEKEKGMAEVGYSHSENDRGIPQLVYSIIEKYKGIKQDTMPVIENDKGITSVFVSNSAKTIEKKEADYQLPPTLALSDGNIGSLRARLSKTSFKVSRYDTRNAAAKILIHFYNKGNGSHKALKSLTGYSTGGLGKLMMIMRNKGMIQRTKFQQYVPSAVALQIMKEARLVQ